MLRAGSLMGATMTNNLRIRSLLAVGAAVFSLLGCGSDGLKVEGNVRLTVRQTGQPDGSTAFEFPPDTVVDPGAGLGGVYGSCSHVGTHYEIELTRDGAGADQFKSVRFTIPQRGDVTTTPALSFTLGQSVYTGSGTCTATATPADDTVSITAHCTGLRSNIDPRVLESAVNLVFTNCS